MKQVKKRKFVVCLDHFESMKDYSLITKFLSMGICIVLIWDAEENFSLLTENKGKRAIEDSDIPEIEDCPVKLSVDEKVLLKILQEWKSLPARGFTIFTYKAQDILKVKEALETTWKVYALKDLLRQLVRRKESLRNCKGRRKCC